MSIISSVKYLRNFLSVSSVVFLYRRILVVDEVLLAEVPNCLKLPKSKRVDQHRDETSWH